MADYSKREQRRADVIEDLRRRIIAEDLGLPVEHHGRAVWLFCPWCGNRKLTDAAWFAKHVKEDETATDLRSRMPCLNCGRRGSLLIIPAPASLKDMPNFLKTWDIRGLVLQAKE